LLNSYHCLFCHGYEDKGAEASAVLAVQALAMMPPLAVHMADNAKQLSSEVTILTHGSEEVAAQVKAVAPKSPFRVDSREIARLKEVDDGVEVHFKDGNFKRVKFLVHGPLTVPQGEFVWSLHRLVISKLMLRCTRLPLVVSLQLATVLRLTRWFHMPSPVAILQL
jgi:hypothetical protein